MGSRPAPPRCRYEYSGPCRDTPSAPLCKPCTANGGPIPAPVGRICRCGLPAVDGKRLCQAHLDKNRANLIRARAVVTSPSSETEKRCTKCEQWKPLEQFCVTKRNGRGEPGRKAECDDCAKARHLAWRHRTGTLPMRRRLPVDGMLTCTLCTEKKPTSAFARRQSKIERYESRCKECRAATQRQRRALGTACECGEVKEPGYEACPTCLEIDGVTKPEKMLISSLQVLGGEAQLSELIEDQGGDPDEDQAGPVTRRVHRGLARMREQGRTRTTYEGVEGHSKATHALKGVR